MSKRIPVSPVGVQSLTKNIRRSRRCQVKISPAEYAAARLAGKSVSDIAVAQGVTVRSVQRTLALRAQSLLTRQRLELHRTEGHRDVEVANAYGYSLLDLAQLCKAWGMPDEDCAQPRHYPQERHKDEIYPPIDSPFGPASWRQGYYRLSLNTEHPFYQYPGRAIGQGYLPLHRVVAFDAAFRAGRLDLLTEAAAPWSEKYGAWWLPPRCVVHHLDGNRQNNADTNLEITPGQSEHIKGHWRRGDMKNTGRNWRKAAAK